MTATNILTPAAEDLREMAVEWAMVRFGATVVHEVVEFRHHADLVVRVSGYDNAGRYFEDERYAEQLEGLIANLVEKFARFD